MDRQTEHRTHVGAIRHLASVEASAASSKPDERLAELRAEAMRRLFPKRSASRTNWKSGRLALQVYDYLAEATSVEELQRRLRFPLRYPVELIEDVELRDGRTVLVRPVLPPDASMHRAFVLSMSPTTRRYRFHAGVADLPDPVLRYLTEVDYVDHMALVGEVHEVAGPRQVAEARWVRRAGEPDTADFAIAIADDYQLSGLGRTLLDMLERSAAARGIDRLCGHVLRNNVRMVGWLEARGWRMAPDADDPGVVCAELPLRTTATQVWRKAA